MTDNEFWKLVDKYQEPYRTKTRIGYTVSIDKYEDLAKDIVRLNNKDLDKCLADLYLFDFKRGHAPKRVIILIRKLCKESD